MRLAILGTVMSGYAPLRGNWKDERTPMDQGDRVRRPADVGAIINARAVRCVYQPIVRLDTLHTVGYEALVRGPDGTR